jgi:DNA-binding MarR family transcriptional regulator
MAAADLEKLFLEPKRLAILCELLKRPEPVEFTALRKACELTDGNLNSHLKKLSDSKIVKIKKKFVDNKPCTLVALSPFGRSAFYEYIKQLESVVQNAVKRIDRLEKHEKMPTFAGRKSVPEKC